MFPKLVLPTERPVTFVAFEPPREDMFCLDVSPQRHVSGEGTIIGTSGPFTFYLPIVKR